jgi:hypothetical protein
MITAEIFAPETPDLPDRFAQIIHANAVAHLKVTPHLLTIKVAFSAPSDRWYFNLSPLDTALTPSFYVFAPIGRATATEADVMWFIGETREQLAAEMAATYPGTTFPVVPDRTKVVVVEMP